MGRGYGAGAGLRQARDERRAGAQGFAAGAARLAGVVPRLLGWRPDEFWNATPAEIAAILHAGEEPEGQALSRAEFDQLLEREGHG